MATFYSDLLRTTGAGVGTTADAFTLAQFLGNLSGGGFGNNNTSAARGVAAAGGNDVSITNTNNILDGWDGTTSAGPEMWGLTGAFDYYGGSDNATNLITTRGAFNSSTIFSLRASANGNAYTWRNCYFYHGTSLQSDSNRSTITWNFDGCTFKSPLFTAGYNGQIGHEFIYDWCLFDGTVFDFDSRSGHRLTFNNCWFTKTQAEVVEGLPGDSYTFAGCTFSFIPNTQLPSNINLIAPATLRYSQFFPAEYSGTFTGFDHGFTSNSRQGPGAFYFGVPSAAGTASATSGAAPLDVRFETAPTENVDVRWDFNDGTYSEEWQVNKRYNAPGKYTVTLRWTDPLGGTSTTTFTIYVYDWSYSGTGVWASYTDECLRLALHPAKGLGWSEFAGDGWPFPEARVGPLKIIDENYRERQLVLDSFYGRAVEIGRTSGFRDLAGSYDEQNITTEIRFPEEIGEAEHYFLESLEHHAHFRPFSEDDGYPADFGVDFSLLKDGAQTDTLRTVDVPLNGDITPRYVGPGEREAHRWQPRIVTATSGYRLVRLRDYYVARDKAAAPDDRAMTEQGYEQDLANVLLHMGRNELNPVLNFATGADFTGSYSSTVTGPDGRDDSALAFVGTGLTSADSLSLSGDFSIVAWVNNIGSTQTILNQASGFRLRVVVGADYRIEYRDGSGTHTSSALSWSGTIWGMLTVVRNGRTLSMYHDDTLVFSQEITVASNTGTVQVCPATCYGFDIKVIDAALAAGAVAYHHTDVVDKEGAGTCPLY